MLRWQWSKPVLAMLGVAVLCAADAPAGDWAMAPLEHARLVLWVVHPASGSWRAQDSDDAPQAPVQLPKTVQEQTAGSFGRASSEIGQTAGTYGAHPSEVGTDLAGISRVKPASADAGGFGHASSDVGQTAGSYGQAASSYGEGLSTIATAADQHPSLSRLTQKHTAQFDGLAMNLRGAYPGLELVVFDVKEEELAQELQRTLGTTDAPDVLVGSPLPWRWTQTTSGKFRGLTLGSLGPGIFLPAQTEEVDPQKPYAWSFDGWSKTTQAAILSSSHDRRAAEAFLVWLADASVCAGCAPDDPVTQSAVAVAKEAVASALQGGGVASPDPDMAPGSVEWLQAVALEGNGAGSVAHVKVATDMAFAEANERLAVVDVRAIVHTERAFGVTHALVVERRDLSGRWHVLQLTSSLSGNMAHQGEQWIGEYCGPGNMVAVEGVQQAAPLDGDNRSPKPDLLWDPGRGAGMEIVEWQQAISGDTWTGSRLFFVPDRNPHVRTRVTAEFATWNGTYRWRVWSMGQGGALVLSPWRTMVIV